MVVYDMTKKRDRRKAYEDRAGALRSDRSSWHSHWSDIARHLLPRSMRAFITDRNRTSAARYNRIYDNSATRALRVLGAGMMAGATSPARPWFKLTTADPDLASFYPVRMWLDDVVMRMQRVFAKSNTYRALHQMYEELGAFGTAVSIVVPDFQNVIHHYPVVCGEYCLQQDYKGHVNTLYREFERSVAEVVAEFGRENCSTSVKNAFDEGALERPVQILHVIEPRRDHDPSKPDAMNMPWRSCYLELGSGDEDKMLREGGFERFPVLAPRWFAAGGDVYGSTCPGMEALGDIRQLQHEQLMKGTGISYQVRPPLQIPTSLKDRDTEGLPGGVSYFEPGVLLPFDQALPQGGIRSAFEVKLELDHLLADVQDVRQRIREAFFSDLFLMLANAGPDTRMTATEVAERHEEKLLMLGPMLERLHTECLQPLIDLTFDTMMAAGALPPPPPELQGVDLSVEFVSILAQAQRAIGSNSIDRYVSNVLAVAAVKPDVLDKINFDKWADISAQRQGVDTEMLNDDEAVAALRKARAEAEAARERVALNREQAATAKDLAAAQTGVQPQQNALTDLMGTVGPVGAEAPV